MAHQKSTSKKSASATSRGVPGKGSAKDVKPAGGAALAQKHGAGQKKGGKRKG